MAKTRIKLAMSIEDILEIMSDGNPGALQVCKELMTRSDQVDPETFSGGTSNLLMLDTLGIYGERIYLLWSKVCEKNIGKVIAVLRAYQFGHLAGVSPEALNLAVDTHPSIDLDAVVKAVKSRIPSFNLA